MASAGEVVLLIDGASGLENMGRLKFKDCVQIVDFYHALEHAGLVLAALIGKDNPNYKARHHRWAKRTAQRQSRGAHRTDPPGVCRQAPGPGTLGMAAKRSTRIDMALDTLGGAYSAK